MHGLTKWFSLILTLMNGMPYSERGVNYSKILQAALIEYLNIDGQAPDKW